MHTNATHKQIFVEKYPIHAGIHAYNFYQQKTKPETGSGAHEVKLAEAK